MTTMRESLAAKMTAGAIAVVMTLSAFSTFAQTANAATDIEELCALATSLGISTPEFDALCAGDSEDDSAGAGEYVHHPSIDFEFTRNLYIGDRGNDVMMLQRVLNQDPDTQLAASGVGSAGMETEYFGELTRAAVAKFQAKHGISPAAGYFYPLTRAEMNRMGSGSGDDDDDDNVSDVSGDTLEVEAGDQPDDTEVAEAQQHVPATVVELTTGDENVDVSDITAEVTGNGRDAVDSVSVWYDGMIVDTDSVNSNDIAELDMDMEIDDDETIELVFSVTMESGTSFTDEDGLDFQVEVTDIDAGDTDVDGLPVDGAEHTVRENLEMNEFSMEIDMEGTDVEIGDEEEMIATVNFENDDPNNDNDSMFVVGFSLEQDGTMSTGDIENVYAEVDDEEYEADIDGDYYRFDFGSGIEIEEDDDMDFEIFADIVDGATEDIDFTLDADDLRDFVYVVDEDDRYLSEASDSVDLSGSKVEIKAGTGDSSGSNEVTDDTITAGEDDAELASFDMDVEGESITGDIDVDIDVTNTSNDSDEVELSGIKIVDTDGNTIASADDDTTTATSGSDFVIDIEFEDVTFPVGDETYILVADINDDVDNATKYTVDQIDFTSFEGDESDEDVSVNNVTDDTVQTVEGAALAMGVDSSLEDDDTRDDVDGVELGVVQLDASDSGEDIDVNEIALTFTASSSSANNSDISNCVLVDEDGDEVSDEVDPSSGSPVTEEFDMDSGFTVSKDTVVSLSLQCDINDDWSDTDSIKATVSTSSSDVEADVAGDVDPTEISGGNTGDAVTIVAASLSSANDEDAEYQSVRTNTTVDLGSVELDSDNVEGILEELPLVATGTELLNSNRKVTVKDAEGDVVAYAYFTSDNIVVENFEKDVMLEDEEKAKLFFEAELSASVASEGDDLSIDIDDGNAKVDGDTFSVASTSLTAVDVYSGLPSIVVEEITSGDISDDVIMKFSVAAEGEDIVFDDATVASTTVSVTGSATTGGSFSVYGGTSYSNAVDEDDDLSSADITIDDGDTHYFVVKGSNVSEGDNGDTIKTTMDLDDHFGVGVIGDLIDVVEGDDVNNSEELVYKYTN